MESEVESETVVVGGGRIVLPKAIREATGLKPGVEVTLRTTKEGVLVIPRKKRWRPSPFLEYALSKDRPAINLTLEEIVRLGDETWEPGIRETGSVRKSRLRR
ncbi:MAG: AbrB/MazE/SpoVT family DNA-binding domain-containing protein [Halobacteria archaeon]